MTGAAAAAARELTGEPLRQALQMARTASLQATLDLDDAQWRVPYDPGIQPTAWDLAHMGWFAEFWLLRGPHGIDPQGNVTAHREAAVFGPDAHYDSARVAHRDRWTMPLLPRDELLVRLDRQLQECVAAVADAVDDAIYHARFCVYHELMHVEALHWTRARLGYPAAPGLRMRSFAASGELAHQGGEHRIGRARDGSAFAFDNEQPGRTVHLRPFRIDRAPVTNAAFAAFVEADGYARREFWPGRAGEWLLRRGRSAPERWRRGAAGAWEHRWFDQWLALPADAPVVHVNAFEAEAYCAFVGRRLPHAAEWEVAADAIDWGHSVWEWTADAFGPYPGFRPGPYTTYSAPWFHWQRELRGGAFATHTLLHNRSYRNFFLPQRTDVFAGFRTAADA